MNLIRMFLENQPPSDDNAEVERIACKAKMYHLIDGVLYRRGDNGMMIRCIHREEGIQPLQDIHNDVCGSHSSWCSIIGKAFRHGFYWPTTKDDDEACKSSSADRSLLALRNLGNQYCGHLTQSSGCIQIFIHQD
jgi:hypothetical protein